MKRYYLNLKAQWILLLILALAIGCGRQDPINSFLSHKKNSKNISAYTEQFGGRCSDIPNIQSTEQALKRLEANENIEISNNFLQLSEGDQWREFVKILEMPDLTPFSPWILSSKIIIEHVDRYQLAKNIINFFKQHSMLTKSRIIEGETLLSQFKEFVLNSFNRWRNQQCRIEQLKKESSWDQRSLIFFEHAFLEGCNKNWECLMQRYQNGEISPLARSFIEKNLMNMSWEQMTAAVESKQKSSQEHFFGIRQTSFKPVCQKMDVKATIKLFLTASKSLGPLYQEALQKGVNQHWNLGQNQKIEVIFTTNKGQYKKGIRIKETDNPISFVNDNEPNVIYISKNILNDKNGLSLTIAHELGHTFGLPDCYLEFIDDQGQGMYYGLRADHLMCNLSPFAKIPQYVVQQIFTKNCE